MVRCHVTPVCVCDLVFVYLYVGSEADVKAALLKMHPTLAMFRADETPAPVSPPPFAVTRPCDETPAPVTPPSPLL